MLFILLIFVSLIAVSGVSAADADAGDVVAISDVDDSDVLAVDNEAEPMSVDVAQETDVVAEGNSSFNIGDLTGNGSSFNLGNLTGNGSSFSFGNRTGNSSSFSFGNSSSFSFNGTFSFGNTTGNGSFDIGSILGMLGGGSSKDTIEAADLTKYYTKTTTFKTTVKNGNQTLTTGSVVFTIQNKEYVGHIGSDGVASVSLKALKPGTYYIFSEYGQTIVKNVIKIKKSVITKNVSKKYKKAGKFTVKILNSKGKPYAKQTVKVKFKGKTYSIKTNSKGIATLKLSKKLKVGKYTIKTTYAGLTLTNKITVKK